jgi:putative heme iron utilization protein
MDANADFKPAVLARKLLRTCRQGALATLMPGSGDPYCSLVNIASAPDGAPVLLISKLANHTKNILNDARVSLMLDERAAGDPLEGARIMVAGVAERAEGDDIALLKRRYLAAHPSAEMFAGFGDFGFFRIAIKGVHLVAGFGRIVDLKASDVMIDVASAAGLIGAESDIVAHMNDDHADTMNLYATALLGAPFGQWRCTGCDPAGLDMQNGAQIVRLDFPQAVASPAALRQVLKVLADRARSATPA